MKGARVLLIALGLLAVLAQCAFSAQVWTEQRITTSGSASSPVMGANNTVYWVDVVNNDIRASDPVGGERILRQVPRWTHLEAVFQNKFLYTVANDAGLYDLYLWDGVNPERLISNTAGSGSMYGDVVTWDDNRTGVSQVYAWDPVNGERAIAPTSTYQANPKIWGDTVVWEDYWLDAYMDEYRRVYMWNPTEGVRYLGTDRVSPAIYGDKVVMWEISSVFPYHQASSPGLWQWTPQNGGVRLNTLNMWEAPASPGVWGDIAIWGGASAWDPVNGVTRVTQSQTVSISASSIYGRQVAWLGHTMSGYNNNDIYVSTFVPEPGGLCVLAFGFLGCAGGLIRSRKR